MVEAAGGWFLYMRGQRLKREQAEAEARASARPRMMIESQGNARA